MLTLNNPRIRMVLKRLQLPDAEFGRVHLIGIRGALPDPDGVTIRTGAGNDPNAYNDAIGVFGPTLRLYKGSVDPGLTPTLDPMNPQGCAHLLNGAYLYQPGMHKGHPALIPAGPSRVWRDANRDGIRDPHDQVETGSFGIDIHAGGTSSQVNDWSAGCQVVWGGWSGASWLEFRQLYMQSCQREFRYYLLDASDLN
jgi:hypothetical protein